MSDMAVLVSPSDRAGFTVADLESLPDDGQRYEILDGALIVSPSPMPRHQVAANELLAALRAACPPHLYVVMAPFDVRQGSRTSLQPDLLVFERTALAALDRRPTVMPVLVVEVISPSSRLLDLNTKRAAYERMGIPAYWVVDPQPPSLVAWDLRDGAYLEVARAESGEAFVVERPFPLSLAPRDLTAGLGD